MKTKGKWISYCDEEYWLVFDESELICTIKQKENPEEISKFIALSGTIANQLDEQGINGERAIELLPEILAELKLIKKCQCCLKETCKDCKVPKIEHIFNKLQQPQSASAESEKEK